MPFATESDAGKIADAFRNAIYAERQQESYFGVPLSEFTDLIHLKRIVWAPDGDEAFDDRSYVLQFDIRDRVRLIAFKCGEGYLHDPTTLSDIWLAADDFYQVLQGWHDAFEAEWASTSKASDADVGVGLRPELSVGETRHFPHHPGSVRNRWLHQVSLCAVRGRHRLVTEMSTRCHLRTRPLLSTATEWYSGMSGANESRSMYSVQFGLGVPKDLPQGSTHDGFPTSRTTSVYDAPACTARNRVAITEFDCRALRIRRSVWKGELQTTKSKKEVRTFAISTQLCEHLKTYLLDQWRRQP